MKIYTVSSLLSISTSLRTNCRYFCPKCYTYTRNSTTSSRTFPHLPIQFQEYSRVSTAATDQANSFWLKWLPGTRVSRCYGCNREIVNPPNSVPDDLIVAYRDIRQYRQRNTGQLQFSNGPQNVHFHLRAACIRARYPNFPGASALVVPNDMKAHFRLEHIQRLDMEFGWSPQ